MNEAINRTDIGFDSLDPKVKRAKILNKARILETGSSETDDEILNQAINNAEDSNFKGILDPGPLTD